LCSMTKRIGTALSAALCLSMVTACAKPPRGIGSLSPASADDTVPPVIQREMRGLWVATVHNIDWPSTQNLTAVQQQAELVDIMARAQAAGINTIVFQVRPAGDALYQSALEPWAPMFNGSFGVSPGYDPLAFAIHEAHARGMELHAWINPFRAGNAADTVKMVAPHLFNTRRDLIHVYGKDIWMDPGEPDVQDYSIRVVEDIVRRYDIDGIHADDYFYPYVVDDSAGNPVLFPDSATYAKYGAGMSLDDWRRSNIDKFVERMYREVHAIKPTIKVGISPFGIWRPGNPPSVAGLDAYASIYADSRKWLQQGWVDYLAPQLYWAIASPKQSYPALLDWWVNESTMGRHVWPGLAASRVDNGRPTGFQIQEIPEQILAARKRSPESGTFLFNTTAALRRNNGALATLLAGDLYKDIALVPASKWLDSIPPADPSLAVASGVLQITPAAGETPRWWVLRVHSRGTWSTRILFWADRTLRLPDGFDRVIVQAVDQAGNTSAGAEWRRPP
jgi:uncharacterized lipoprotein YddW (UPF0748 family)